MASYNAGDILIEVTGGSVSSYNRGVAAAYAIPHDQNGEITVLVAEGATVTGDVDGIYVANAGVTTFDYLRTDQAVTLTAQLVVVNGTVRGGTGAAVHMSGGGALVIGPNGEVIAGSSGTAILANDPGDLLVLYQADENGNIGRVRGAIQNDNAVARTVAALDHDGDPLTPPIVLASSDDDPGTQRSSVPLGAYDIESTFSGGRLSTTQTFGPRARVYEALPSVLLGLNGLASGDDRMAAQRAGGVWVRAEASSGSWEADGSTSGVDYDFDRYGVEVGLGVPLNETTALGLALHQRRADADVANGGDITATGTGMSVSGTMTGDRYYVLGQAAVTWYDVDMSSSLRGHLKNGADGIGVAGGAETGFRMALGGMSLTPRVALTHSSVSVDSFMDSLGNRVSLDDGRSLNGLAGVRVDLGSGESRLFGSADVEHELSGDRLVTIRGTKLKSDAEATWARLNLGGVHVWGVIRRGILTPLRG